MASTTRKRLSGTGRRELIIDAAALVFAEKGMAGSTTKAIAQRAGVSEALLYRHFPSKEALYFAVLRNLVRVQNDEVRRLIEPGRESTGIVEGLRTYFRFIVSMAQHPENSIAHRVMMASVAGDGTFARRVYRRSLRMYRPTLLRMVEEATASGELQEPFLVPENTYFFIDHIGSMMAMSLLSERPVFEYRGSTADLIEQAVIFCARGMGICRASDLARFANEKQPLEAGAAG